MAIVVSGQQSPAVTDLQPLSLNSLLIHASPGSPWFTWASSVSLVMIWMIFGIVPAAKAAQLNPIDALRYE